MVDLPEPLPPRMQTNSPAPYPEVHAVDDEGPRRRR